VELWGLSDRNRDVCFVIQMFCFSCAQITWLWLGVCKWCTWKRVEAAILAFF